MWQASTSAMNFRLRATPLTEATATSGSIPSWEGCGDPVLPYHGAHNSISGATSTHEEGFSTLGRLHNSRRYSGEAVGAPRADRVRGTGCVDMPATALYHRARQGWERSVCS